MSIRLDLALIHDSQVEALAAAIDEARREGGGTVWLHRAECDVGDDEPGPGCVCEPYPIEVPALH